MGLALIDSGTRFQILAESLMNVEFSILHPYDLCAFLLHQATRSLDNTHLTGISFGLVDTWNLGMFGEEILPLHNNILYFLFEI